MQEQEQEQSKDKEILYGILHFSAIGTPFIKTENAIIIVNPIGSIMLFHNYEGCEVEYYKLVEKAAVVGVKVGDTWKRGETAPPMITFTKEKEEVKKERLPKVVPQVVPQIGTKTWRVILSEAEWEAGIKVPEDLVEFLEKYYHFPQPINSKS